jgi:arginase family enzyme
MYDLHDFLEPVLLQTINEDNGYNDGQFAKHITLYETEIPDLTDVDIVLVGVTENRGAGIFTPTASAPDAIRKQLYPLHFWHKDLRIADIGNIKTGANLTDSYAAVKTVLAELLRLDKTVVILGGSHDVTLAHYYAYV